MKRRTFISILAGVMSMWAGGLGRIVKGLTPKKFTRAETTITYPGTTEVLDKKKVRNISPWSG